MSSESVGSVPVDRPVALAVESALGAAIGGSGLEASAIPESAVEASALGQPGQLLVLTGPSGVGKGTLVRRLRQRYPQVFLSISATTRSPRSGEEEGRDYYFVTRDRFEAMIAAGELLEWAEFAGNYYGTPRGPIETRLQAGDRVLLEIELAGARQVRDHFPEAWRVFILPPSMAELERRLRSRGQDSETKTRRLPGFPLGCHSPIADQTPPPLPLPPGPGPSGGRWPPLNPGCAIANAVPTPPSTAAE